MREMKLHQQFVCGFLPVFAKKPGQSEEIKKAIDRNRDLF
jgi:hypothetical protein